MNFSFISFLQAAPGGGQGGNMWQTVFFFVLLIGVFYLFFIRPQMKRQKESRKYREGLQKGQKVITIGGLHGKIVEIQETTVTLEVENGVRMRFEKSAIASNSQDQLPESGQNN